MAYPLIILGAGASMDYLRADDYLERRNSNFSKYKSPLMNQLFDDFRFNEILNKYPKISSFATNVMNAMSKPNANFEDYLTNSRDNLALNNPAVYSQLVSLIFYLADLFSVISIKYYYTINHYKDLFQNIDNFCAGQACIVNFNYDLLLEKSLSEHLSEGFDISKLSSYIGTNIKIIKIHGACNWRYNPQLVQTKQINAIDFFTQSGKELIENPPKNQIYPQAVDIHNINFDSEYSEGLKSWTVRLPALALPLKNKTSSYVCEESHITVLNDCIEKADRVLIIGWRGTDEFLPTVIKNKLINRGIPTLVVTKNSPPESVIEYYRNKIPNLQIKRDNVYQSGFSEFMKMDDCEQFFK